MVRTRKESWHERCSWKGNAQGSLAIGAFVKNGGRECATFSPEGGGLTFSL
jgi:hypothetical protein